MSEVLSLTAEDFMVATTKGAVRQLRAIKTGMMGKDHGSNSNRTVYRRLSDSILGEMGELAVARYLDLPLTSGWNSFRTGDVGGMEVKTTEQEGGHLLIHKTTPSDSVCILVVMSGLDAKLAGWVKAADVQNPHHWRDGNPGCYWVKQEELRPMEGLK